MLILIRKTYVFGLLLLASCASVNQQSNNAVNTDTLAGLQAMANTAKPGVNGNQKNNNKFRETALKETALSLGAQAGLASRAKTIDDELVKATRHLDTIYDFNALLLDNNVLPPVLVEGRNTFNMANLQTIRISNRTYKVVKQAQFVTTPPGWRQYLWMDYAKPDTPHASLLPKNKDEKLIWYAYVEKGWQQGVEQANIILEENIARIKEDFIGMILYRKLLAMNMVSAPYVSHTDLGITGDGNEIHIDDKVLRITALPALNMNSAEWRAAIAKNENRLEHLNKLEESIKLSEIKVTDSWKPVIDPIS